MFFSACIAIFTLGAEATAKEAVAALGGETSFLTTSSPPPQLSAATPAAAKPTGEGKLDEADERKVTNLRNKLSQNGHYLVLVRNTNSSTSKSSAFELIILLLNFLSHICLFCWPRSQFSVGNIDFL